MRKFIFPMLLVLVAGVLTSFVQQNPEADRLMGVWEPSNGRARVKIEKIGTKYYGKFVWLKEPIDPATGQPKTDKNNPDPSMKNVPLKGYRMLKDFVYKGNNEWADGTIYDPLNGST